MSDAGTIEKPEAKRQLAIKAPAFKSAEYARQVYCATVEPGVTRHDILRPDFWMHVANDLKPSDHIEVYWEDGSYYVELLTVAANRTGARVAVLNEIDLRGSAPTMDMGADLAQFSVKWGGPAHRFRVLKEGVKEPLKDGLATEADGWQWLMNSEHIKNGKKAA